MSIVKEHIETGNPVGSKALAEHARFGLSSATIRNEMAELENAGLIIQPHTSAGRVPSEKGWKYYLEHLMEEKLPDKKDQETLKNIVAGSPENFALTLKAVARTLADMSHNAAIVGFSADDVYYTGLSNLFHEPEFANINLVQHVSEIVDHLDEVMKRVFKELPTGKKILIGKDNPFGKECAVLVDKFLYDGSERVIGILGPVRMAYDANSGLMTYTSELLTE